MQLNLQSALLIKRYKRFLADIQLPDGTETTIHCPNTGAMTGCADPGSRVYFSTSENPKRKYPHTWELCLTPQKHWVAVNTNLANQLVYEAITENKIGELIGYTEIKKEVKYGESSRIDLLLTGSTKPDCYLEVKSVTLLENNLGYFPDAETKRGQKHLKELIAQVELGQRACLLFCVQHSAIQTVSAAQHIDPSYATLLSQAKQAGVEILAYKAQITPEQIVINQPVDVLC